MRKDRINQIIEKVYVNRYDLEVPTLAPRHQSPFYLNRVKPVLTRLETFAVVISRRKILVSSIIFAMLLIGMTIYYYNLLVITQQNMLTTMGHVQALLQRRNDTAVNLSKAVRDYAEHEKAVLSAVVILRGQLNDKQTGGGEAPADLKSNGKDVKSLQGLINKEGSKPPAPGATPSAGAQTPDGAPSAAVQTSGGALPSGLLNLAALAEQYPDLKLSANFQTLMTVLDQIEKDLAAGRMKQDEMVNIYTTYVQTFPSNVFAAIFGFRLHPYFSATEEAKTFKSIDY
jgi:LemA protein